jgi:hypothetical protein
MRIGRKVIGGGLIVLTLIIGYGSPRTKVTPTCLMKALMPGKKGGGPTIPAPPQPLNPAK